MLLQEGWTKYFKDGRAVKVPYPEGDAFVFDIEVLQSTGQTPTLATAVSADAWYRLSNSLHVPKDFLGW